MFSININNKIVIPSHDADTILKSALRNGVDIPYECNSGGCGACKVEIVSGGVKNIYPDSPGLNDRDVKKNRILACQSIPVNDIEIKIEQVGMSDLSDFPSRNAGTLSEIYCISKYVTEFTFSFASEVKFKPGQYFLINVPGVGDRAYSASSPSGVGGKVKFIIKNMVGGRASSYFFNSLKIGDEVIADGPYGHAYLIENKRDIVCIAGGAGLSPIASIIRSFKYPASNKRLYFFYGVNDSEEINTDFIADMTSDLSVDFEFIPALTSPNKNWDGKTGYIHEVVKSYLNNHINKEYYFCGPPIMASSVQELLIIKKQVPCDQLHFDRFF